MIKLCDVFVQDYESANFSSHSMGVLPFISSRRYGINGLRKGSLLIPGAKSEVVVMRNLCQIYFARQLKNHSLTPDTYLLISTRAPYRRASSAASSQSRSCK